MLTLNLVIVFLLILLNGFFAMAEIALVSSRPARLQPYAERGSAGAKAALELKSDPSRLLATVQIGVTVIAVLTGTFGQATLGDQLQEHLAARPGDRRISAVMTPRTQVEFLDLEDSDEENRRRIRDSSYSRFPIVEGGTHQLAGIVQAKDLLDAVLAGQPFSLRAVLKAPLFL